MFLAVKCANDPDLPYHGEVEFETGGDSDEDWDVDPSTGDDTATEDVQASFTFRLLFAKTDGDVLVPESEEEACKACGGG